MRRGCISLGEVRCDDCHHIIPYPERYLIVEETEGAILRLCVDCCLKKGYVYHKQEKGERVTTFFVA
jgi:RNase P subunit RPR2